MESYLAGSNLAGSKSNCISPDVLVTCLRSACIVGSFPLKELVRSVKGVKVSCDDSLGSISLWTFHTSPLAPSQRLSMSFWTCPRALEDQSSQQILKITVSLPKSVSCPLLGISLSLPTFLFAAPLGEIRCYRRSPSFLKPIRSVVRTEVALAELVIHCTRRSPNPPSDGGSRAYCSKRPTLLVVT